MMQQGFLSATPTALSQHTMFGSLNAAAPPRKSLLSTNTTITRPLTLKSVRTVPLTNPENATKQALLCVVQVWLDRLQAMAVIVTVNRLLEWGY